MQAGRAWRIRQKGSQMPCAIKETEKVIGDSLERNVIEYPDSYPADEPMRRCPDITKASLQLEYEPKVALEEGLARFYAWTDKNYKGHK